MPALGQLLHLFAELGERFDRELRIVSLQDIVVAVGIDEFEDRLALGIDHPLRLFRHEDLEYWGVTEVFGPMWLARGLGLYSRVSNLSEETSILAISRGHDDDCGIITSG